MTLQNLIALIASGSYLTPNNHELFLNAETGK
jgi:hypothetical protein